MGDVERLDFVQSPAVKRLTQAWAKPIEGPMEQIAETIDKPLAELTMPDLLAWVFVLGYAALTGYVLGQIAGNIALTVLRGPPRLR